MATYTDNYALVKPTYGELADVAVINGNMDTIDGIMHSNRTMLAPAFSQTEDYAVGDVVVYEGNLYRFIVPHTAGNWDGTEVEQTTLGEEVSTKGGADVTKTASGNPIEITDGANAPLVKCVTAIQGNQDLHGYDKPWVGGAGKNKLPMVLNDIKSANTSGTWSGNTYTVGSFTLTLLVDSNDNVTGINLNGTSDGWILFALKTNYPINANTYLLSCVGASGNKYLSINLNEQEVAVTSNNDVQVVVSENTTMSSLIVIRPNSTITNAIIYPMIRLSTETDPTFAPYSNICPITAYDEGEIVVRGKNLFDVNSATSIETPAGQTRDGLYINVAEGDYTFSTSSLSPNGFYIRYKGDTETDWHSTSVSAGGVKTINLVSDGQVCLYVASGNYCSDLVEPMMEKGSTATPYEPYTSTTHTATFSSAIYRGSEDVVKGEVTSEWKVIDLGSLTWGDASAEGWSQIVYAITDILHCRNSEKAHMISDSYEVETANVVFTRTKISIGLNQNNILQIFNSSFANMTGAQIASALNGSMLAYELATPTTETITPTNLPIKSLFGYNHIESSTGEMEVEYITQEFQPIVDLIQSNKHVYSTAEQIVGTWTDGSTVYEKTLYYAALNVSRSDWTILEAFTLDKLIDATVSFTNNTRYLDESYMRISFFNGNIYYHTPEINGTCDDVYVTVRYTKPSSNTRSLNLTKSAVEEIPDEIKNAEYEEKPDVNEADDNAPTEVDER